ncbi:MAG: hypothetical protein MUC56_11020 [Thermoanaerobaculales bacterium]|jgi:hypothetical protein|nr:hypothetical protein [Thermoanaerobaculales bacterium]
MGERTLKLVVLVAASAAAVTASAQTCDWRWVNPMPPRTDLYRLKHEVNAFVGVGAAGTIVRSTDGYTWQAVASGSEGDLFGVDWGAGFFVAVGEGVVLRSPTGQVWTTVYTDPDAVLVDVEFSASRFVAVGDGLEGNLLTSAFGAEWELVPAPWTGAADAITGADVGFYVAVGVEIWYSPNGFDWELEGAVPASGSAIPGAARGKKTGGDLFDLDRIDLGWTGSRLLWSSGSELWSRDEKGEWSLAAALGGCPPWSDWLGLASGSGWVVASGISGCPTPYLDPAATILVSVDGGVTFRPPWEDELGGFPALGRYGSRWVAAGAYGDVVTSSNGSTWACLSGGCSSLACADDLVDIALDGDRWLAVGGLGLCENELKRRSGGTTASRLPAGGWSVHPQSTDRFYGVASTGDGLIAVGDGWIGHSDDGASWLTEASPEDAVLHSVESGGGWVVAAGNGGDLFVSDGGGTWFKPFLYLTEDLERVVWDGGQFVVLGRGGVILRSPDAMNWSEALTATGADLWGAARGPDGWIAVGEAGTVLASPAGEVWLPRRSGVGSELRDVIWAGDRFVAVGWDEAADGSRPAVVLASADGVRWTSFGAPGEALHRIRKNGASWIAIGGDRTILETDCLGTMLAVEQELLQMRVGESADLEVVLSAPAPAASSLAVTSSHPGRAGVPASVAIAAGADRLWVPVSGLAVVSGAVVTLTLPAGLGGGVTTALVSVQPPLWTPRRPSGRVEP